MKDTRVFLVDYFLGRFVVVVAIGHEDGFELQNVWHVGKVVVACCIGSEENRYLEVGSGFRGPCGVEDKVDNI